MRVVDLSITLTDGFPAYPGDIPVSIKSKGTHSSDGYSMLNLGFSSHTATHVDLPYHFISDGATIDTSPPETFFGEAMVVSIPKNENEIIQPSDFETADIRQNDILLISTGWEKHTGSDYFYRNHPFLSAQTAEYLLQKKIKGLGCDLPSIDKFGESLVHKLVLGSGVVIFESLVNLREIAGKRIQFFGLPLRIAGGDGSPIRAIAVEP